ncbi:MAG: hypothetical protein ACJA1C_001992 [Crocinitomicaceae bacterium]|jgi:hypothetical protein
MGKFKIEQGWRTNAESVTNGVANKDNILDTFFAVLGYVEMNDWKGACHATCGILHVLLKEQGIDNHLILGEAKNGPAVFNHSWIEIEGEVYDVAIGNALIPQFSNPPTIKGFDIETSSLTKIEYGVNSGEADDPPTKMIKSMSIGDYMEAFPGHPLGLWMAVKDGAEKLGIKINIDEVRTKYRGVMWTVK